MDDFETKGKIDEIVEYSDQIAKKEKHKGRLVLYLPAFFIALVTITLLLLMIFGTLFGGFQASDTNSVLLHAIDFTTSEASFNLNYSYHPSATEETQFFTGQGFRWDTLDSQIRISVPSYENNLSLDISFGAFNAKTYDAISNDAANYTVIAYSVSDSVLNRNDVTIINQGIKKTIVIDHDAVSYLLLSFIHPITYVDGVESVGYLYLNNLQLFQLSN